MKRMRTFIMGKVGPPFVAAALLALLFTGFGLVYAVHVSGSSQIELAGDAGQSACYAWDAVNITGEDADSLRIDLSGVQTVTQVYVGDANPLGDAAAGSGYDAANDRYALVLGPNGSTVGPAETVHVGVCVPQPFSAVRLVWSVGGNALEPETQLPVLQWNWEGSDAIHLELTNNTGVTTTLLALQALDPGAPLALDDLDATVADQLPLAGVAQDEPGELVPGSVVTSTLNLGAAPSGSFHTVVLEAQWSDGDDLSVVNRLFAQTSGPANNHLYLPAVLR